MSSVVIVGAGECGARAALELRKLGFEGQISLVGGEDIPAYERPPLSKEGIQHGLAPRLIASPEEYRSAGIDLFLSTTVTSIHRQDRVAFTSGGHKLSYHRMLLATGARSRMLAGVPISERVKLLRSHRDAQAIRRHLLPGRRLAVLGGGFIGLELAASARGMGVEVVVFEGQSRLLSRGVHPILADRIRQRHEAEGVTFVFDAVIDNICDEGDRVVVRHSNGHTVEADILVVGIGAVPNVELAEAAGLVIDNGIAVDSRLRTSDPSIFAAGDCCSFPCRSLGNRRIRLESWRNAQDQALHAAGNLFGREQDFHGTPWFWSDQYDLTLQVCGIPDASLPVTERHLPDGSSLVFYLDPDGCLIAAAGLGAGNAIARDIRLAEMLIAAGSRPDRAALADPEVKLKSLLRS